MDFRDTPEEASFRSELRGWLTDNLPSDWTERTPTVGRFDVDEAIAVIEEVATGPTYVTIDIDVLDPAFGGLSSTPEIGGLTSADLLELLRALANMPKTEIVAGDVVEVAPAYDPAGIAALVGANLAFELVSLVVLAL